MQVSKHHSSGFCSPCVFYFFNLYWKCVCANIYICHQCLSNEDSESGRAVPSSCQRACNLAAQRQANRDKPRQLPNLFHHEVGVVIPRPVCYAHTSSHGVSRYEGMHCLKTDQNGSLFPRPFNRCLLVSTLLTSSPCEDKVEAVACWFTASLTGRGRVTLLCIWPWLF